ncbi:MAG: hypothetical protein ABFD80_06935 [Acidobacteriota bacterium]
MTIERERKREIRAERREVQRQLKEHSRAEREARLARHENAKQGAGAVVQDGNEPCYFALRNYHPLFYCERGEHIVREDLMLDHDICIDCAEGGGLRRPDLTKASKEKESEGVGLLPPDDSRQGEKEKTLRLGHEGQLTLPV